MKRKMERQRGKSKEDDSEKELLKTNNHKFMKLDQSSLESGNIENICETITYK